AIQKRVKGSRVIEVSLPFRYIHSASSVVKKSDLEETRKLLKALLPKLYD
ncbi:MAG: M42 family peptidase, partial [Eubacterium sp.]|nr:M42 family peptidase [Eubacterium sp.]